MAQLAATFVPEDVAIISALPIGRSDLPDLLGWHFTKTGKYTVKSGYNILQQHRVSNSGGKDIGPHITPLHAFVWTIKCPPKVRPFMWQAITGCVAVSSNLRKRGLGCDTQCVLCGAPEETINHVLFECPPTRQVWALSQFPTRSGISLRSRILDPNPEAILRVAEDESKAWFLAQLEEVAEPTSLVPRIFPGGGRGFLRDRDHTNFLCFLNGFWKATDPFAGREVEALLWAMRCMIGADNQDVVFFTDCSDLVKMVSSPSEWPVFKTYLEDIQEDKEEFTSFSLILIPRTQNGKADNLAQRVRSEPYFITFVNNVPSHWL
ncbi:PREDICTED: uncharacterized protein LOC104793932 [Camelina sativa]|uniref:Uncharacterized protein LOC104793932 n=1 Tax=Camelina sativa TaxID=90675 RepID=A0ABM0ZPE9_CAMSA|nr:PREDICTED: uncharacterized protein LOC104793932 [Camelina sativa]